MLYSEEQVRPGLIKNRIVQRNLEVAAKKRRIDDNQRRQSKMGTKQLEQERRDEGLSAAITSENKGFAMMAKMGYKQGQSIGKSATGIVEPIGIQLKTDRGGLGREAALMQLKERRMEIKQQKIQYQKSVTVTTEEFRKRMTQKAQERQIESDLGLELLTQFLSSFI